MHSHSISEVDQLQTELNSKYDTSKQYSYAQILSDSEKIPYLEDVKVVKLDITTDNTSSDYIFKVDSSSGDLQIYNNSVCILSYNKALGHWIFGSTDLNDFMSEVNDTLVNHYNAINIISQGLDDMYVSKADFESLKASFDELNAWIEVRKDYINAAIGYA